MSGNIWIFSELKYVKPNLNVYKDMYEDAIERVKEATDGEDVLQLIFEVDELSRRADDLVRMAYIRNTMNTKDPFYIEQQRWFDENLVYYDQAVNNFREAVYNSPFRDYIEERLGTQYFIGYDIQRKTFKEECIELYQKESELCSEYQQLMDSAETEFMGELKSLSQLRSYFGHSDREVRRGAFQAFSKLLGEREEELERIWDQLIEIRNEVGRRLGYENFIPVGYLYNEHIYYSPEDVAIFRNQVVEEIVPLCQKLYDAQKERLGVDELMVYDERAVFKSGNAQTVGDQEYLIEKTREMYHNFSQETGEFIDYMLDHELFEYKERPGKAPGGYGLMLLSKKAPFVFTHFDGTISDFEVITMDLGQAFARYKASRTQPIKEYFTASAELMEMYGLAMSMFAYNYADDFFGEDADKYRFYNLQELLTLIPYACAVDEYQHICYGEPGLTPKERTAKWHELEEKYLPWRKYDEEDDFMLRGGYWYNTPHYFLYPFYYIDYALARVHVFEMKKKQIQHPDITWMEYKSLIEQGGRITYPEMIKTANLTPLFEEGGVAKAVSYAKEAVDEYLSKDL